MKILSVLLISFLLLLCTACNKNVAAKKPACKGPTIPSCVCTAMYDPVCGCDGKTYGNECEAKCAGVTSWTKGPCP